MKAQHIRNRQKRTPFRPFEIELSSGTRLSVLHPENLAIAEDLGAVASPDGGMSLFTPEEVCAIHPLPDGRKRRR